MSEEDEKGRPVPGEGVGGMMQLEEEFLRASTSLLEEVDELEVEGRMSSVVHSMFHEWVEHHVAQTVEKRERRKRVLCEGLDEVQIARLKLVSEAQKRLVADGLDDGERAGLHAVLNGVAEEIKCGECEIEEELWAALRSVV